MRRALLEVEISGDVEKVHTAVTRSQNNKKPQVWSTFGSGDVEKVRTAVARSTFGSQNVKNISGSEHDWKLRCGKHTIIVGTLLEVELLKKCTRLRREAHLEVKSVKNWRSRITFGS